MEEVIEDEVTSCRALQINEEFLTFLQPSMAVLGPRGPTHVHQQYKPHHIQNLQRWEDKTNEMIMVLEANVSVMRSLCDVYKGLLKKNDFPSTLKDECTDDVYGFVAQVESMIYDFKMQIARGKLLVKITNDQTRAYPGGVHLLHIYILPLRHPQSNRAYLLFTRLKAFS
jgi:hypothetical protein